MWQDQNKVMSQSILATHISQQTPLHQTIAISSSQHLLPDIKFQKLWINRKLKGIMSMCSVVMDSKAGICSRLSMRPKLFSQLKPLRVILPIQHKTQTVELLTPSDMMLRVMNRGVSVRSDSTEITKGQLQPHQLTKQEDRKLDLLVLLQILEKE